MRLFVAVAPATPAVEDLDDFLDPRRDADEGVRWTRPSHWHLTLSFMSSVPTARFDALVDGLAGWAADAAPAGYALRGPLAFPAPYAARVLAIGVAEPEALSALAAGVRTACATAGAATQGGAFTPHVTLARFGRPTEATRWIRVLETYAGPAVTAYDVVLVQSWLGQGRDGRVRHEVMATFPLGARQSWVLR